MTLPVLYTPKEVAELWKVTRRTVYEWIKQGRIKACKIGDTVRIPEAELLAFMQPLVKAAPRARPSKKKARKRARR